MRRGLRKLEGSTITVHQPGPSIRGVCLRVWADCLVLGHARHLDNDADLAGEVVIPLAPGVWWQHAPLPATTPRGAA